MPLVFHGCAEVFIWFILMITISNDFFYEFYLLQMT